MPLSIFHLIPFNY